MTKIKNENRPIALIASRFGIGLDWAQRHLDVQEYNNSSRRVIDIMGQEYYVILRKEQAEGMLFSGLIICDSEIEHSLVLEVEHRIRL